MKIYVLKLRNIFIIVLLTIIMEGVQTQLATVSTLQVTSTARDTGNGSATKDDYKRLIADLFSNYDPSLRPRYNMSDKAEINITMKPYLLYEMDMTGQALRVAMIMDITWFDEFLLWDPSLYGGINYIPLPIEKIWHPYISMAADKVEAVEDGPKTALLNSGGNVMMFTHDQIRFPCAVDVTYYPFDTQTCTLVSFLSPITAAVATLYVKEEPTSNRLYYENSAWHLIEFKAQLINKGTYDLINSKFVIRRRVAFNIYTIILPLLALSIVNAFTILVPISSGEKGSISVTIFLAYGFFAALTRDALPHNSLQISSFVIYICALLLVSMASCAYAMVESRIYMRCGCKVFKLPFFNSQTSVINAKDGKEQINGNVNEEKESGPCTSITWEEALGNLDLLVFLVLMLSLIVLNASFWTRMILSSHY